MQQYNRIHDIHCNVTPLCLMQSKEVCVFRIESVSSLLLVESIFKLKFRDPRIQNNEVDINSTELVYKCIDSKNA